MNTKEGEDGDGGEGPTQHRDNSVPGLYIALYIAYSTHTGLPENQTQHHCRKKECLQPIWVPLVRVPHSHPGRPHVIVAGLFWKYANKRKSHGPLVSSSECVLLSLSDRPSLSSAFTGKGPEAPVHGHKHARQTRSQQHITSRVPTASDRCREPHPVINRSSRVTHSA